MTEKEIKDYLKKPYNYELMDELYIYLRNDRKVTNSMNRELTDYASKRIKQKDFNKVLFVQAVKLSIDKYISTPYFKKEYGEYLPQKIDLPTKYQCARQIANYILYDFFRIKGV